MEKFSLSELSSLLYLFGNDVRLLHLYSSGDNFFENHEKLNDLYDLCFDFYDALAEMSISHNEDICNPSDILNYVDWDVLQGDYFTTNDICNEVINRGKYVIDCVNNVREYESFVQSKIDSFMEELDKIINYMFTRTSK